jgi:formylglycine-generating enzyme required for sulfatase activity
MKWGRIILVIFGALVVTALGIDAADTIGGSESTLLSQVISKGKGACPSGMSHVTNIPGLTCVDTYEASPSRDCPHKTLLNAVQSEENLQAQNCYADSVSDTQPWNFLSLSQADQLCLLAGKRLPTADEWYSLAVGTKTENCLINGNTIGNTGLSDCVAKSGAHDMIGNVWEWVDEEVIGNTFNGRPLPEEGYVTSVDAQGVAVTSAKQADDMYGKDYIWTKTEGVFGMIRGGFYGSNDDAGLYTMNASVPTGFATQGVGFRCVKDTF